LGSLGLPKLTQEQIREAAAGNPPFIERRF